MSHITILNNTSASMQVVEYTLPNGDRVIGILPLDVPVSNDQGNTAPDDGEKLSGQQPNLDLTPASEAADDGLDGDVLLVVDADPLSDGNGG